MSARILAGAARMIALLLVFAVPLQGVAALESALRGPLHVHATAQEDEKRAAHPSHEHAHPHEHAQRHYHLPGEAAVAVPDADHDAVPDKSRTEPAGAAFLALVSDRLGLHPPRLANSLAALPDATHGSCTPRRIERPPRLH